MKLILTQEVTGLGGPGDVVEVKDGYGRNYLVPQGKAQPATAERVNQVEHQKRVIAEKRAKELKDLEAVKARLDATALEVDRRKIVLDEPIKSVGEHTVAIRLRSDVHAEFKVTVKAAE